MISAIIAVAENGVMGNNGKLPWPHIKEDMKWFVEKTTNNVVVMGRKTWDSLPTKGKPLKNRINLVVTSQSISSVEGANDVLNGNLISRLQGCQQFYSDKQIFIIGGKEIYEQCFPICRKIYITRILRKYDGDVNIDLDNVLKNFSLRNARQHTDMCRFEIWERNHDSRRYKPRFNLWRFIKNSICP